MHYNLQIGRFGWGELQAKARATGVSERELAETAIDELVQRVTNGDRGRTTVVPDFPGKRSASGAVGVELPADAEAALEAEARRQGVELVRLLEYAVLAHLARQPPE